MKTRITQLLGIEYPIIQGGMAWVAEHNLAAAVSEAGGLGLIGAGGAPAEFIREQIRKVKEVTDKPFGVNLMLMNPEADAIAQIIVEEGVKVVTTGAGNPGKYMSMWKEAGVKVIPVVASVAMAKIMERAGADLIEIGIPFSDPTAEGEVIQNANIRALQGGMTTAGGIGDGRGFAASIMLGAEAIQIGTRFVVARESIAHDNYKKKIIAAKDIDSEVTGTSHGHPVRQIRNNMTREYVKLEKEGAPFEELEKLTLGALRKAVVEGDTVNGTLMAGQIAGLVKKEQTCQEIILEIMEEAKKLLSK